VITTKIRDKADAAFKKEERIREATKAMVEYRAERIAEDQKTARLRSLRLAKEAAEAAAEPAPAVKRKGRKEKTGK
jgi:hypothetical protein